MVIVFFLIGVVCLLLLLNTRGCEDKAVQSDCKSSIIKKLTRQCARWLVAAAQDESPMIAVLHVQYGIGYLWAIKDIATTEEFKKATGLDFLEFEGEATAVQDSITTNMTKVCPAFAGDINQYMARVAGEV